MKTQCKFCGFADSAWIGIAQEDYDESIPHHDLGCMDVLCTHCDALHWIDERLAQSSQSNPSFSTCCNQGKVCIPQLLDPPQALWDLFTSNNTQCKEFWEHIHQYNMALAFTSLGVKEDAGVNAQGSWVFCILGQLCPLLGAPTPGAGSSPQYAQLYIYNPQQALQQQMHQNSNLCEDTMYSCRPYCLDTTIMPQYTNMLMKFFASTRIPLTSQYTFAWCLDRIEGGTTYWSLMKLQLSCLEMGHPQIDTTLYCIVTMKPVYCRWMKDMQPTVHCIMFCFFHMESMNGMMNFARMLRRMVQWNGLRLLKLTLLPISCKHVRMRSPFFYVVENYCSNTWSTCGLWQTKQNCHTLLSSVWPPSSTVQWIGRQPLRLRWTSWPT